MKKAEFIKAVATKLEVTQKEADRIATGVFEVVEDGLVEGKKVPLGTLGKLGTVERAARKARNPQTGEEIDVAPKTAPKYFPSGHIKELVK